MKKLAFIFGLLLPAIAMLPAKGAATPTPELASGVAVAADDDEEEEEPYVEPPFTVYIDIDNADAVYFTVNEKPISHTAGVNTVTVDPGDGYIKVHVNDGYLFSKFEDLDQQDGSYLQYDYQTMPVTIRKIINLGSDDPIIVDGHNFTVRTVATSSLDLFTITVNVDHAAKADLRIGTSIDMVSANNRKIQLVDGVNTITYTSIDKYLHVSGIDWFTPLQSVTFDGKKVASDGSFNPSYAVRLNGEKTAGKVLDVVTAPDAEVDKFAFTALFDDADFIKYVTKMPANKDLTFITGENTFTFNAGDYYQIWTRIPALVCTFNDNPVNYNADLGYYSFYPTDGGTLVVRFNEEEAAPMTFTISIDDIALVDAFISPEGYGIDLAEGNNTVTLPEEGERYRLCTMNNTVAYRVTMDGEEVPVQGDDEHYYDFAPVDGSKIIVLFHKPTSVEAVVADGESSAVYNLRGVKVSSDIQSLPAGIYINGGRKVVVK